MDKRATLILELYKTAPTHEKIPMLMVERWRSVGADSKSDDIIKEIDEVLAQTSDPKLKLEAAYAKAQIKLSSSRIERYP